MPFPSAGVFLIDPLLIDADVMTQGATVVVVTGIVVVVVDVVVVAVGSVVAVTLGTAVVVGAGVVGTVARTVITGKPIPSDYCFDCGISTQPSRDRIPFLFYMGAAVGYAFEL